MRSSSLYFNQAIYLGFRSTKIYSPFFNIYNIVCNNITFAEQRRQIETLHHYIISFSVSQSLFIFYLDFSLCTKFSSSSARIKVQLLYLIFCVCIFSIEIGNDSFIPVKLKAEMWCIFQQSIRQRILGVFSNINLKNLETEFVWQMHLQMYIL